MSQEHKLERRGTENELDWPAVPYSKEVLDFLATRDSEALEMAKLANGFAHLSPLLRCAHKNADFCGVGVELFDICYLNLLPEELRLHILWLMAKHDLLVIVIIIGSTECKGVGCRKTTKTPLFLL
jgi:hypothetical protein